MFEDINSESVR